MDLIIGTEYYWLSAAQYAELQELEDIVGNLLEDFKPGPDGYYYAELSSVDEDEYDFLLDNDFAQTTLYSRSTQPGGGI